MSSLGGAAEVDRVSTEEVETTSKEKCLLGSSVWYTSCYQTKTYMLSSLLSTSLKKRSSAQMIIHTLDISLKSGSRNIDDLNRGLVCSRSKRGGATPRSHSTAVCWKGLRAGLTVRHEVENGLRVVMEQQNIALFTCAFQNDNAACILIVIVWRWGQIWHRENS